LRAVIAELGRREILSVLLEAGATLNSAALSQEIVDKMRVFIAPKLAGFQGTPAHAGAGASRGANYRKPAKGPFPRELKNVTMARFGVDFAVEGYLHDVYGTR
jgi:diaminohydroxyphosphoribosylaminopyrimidine deaminase/5-amino-6-(5-phosphoribosylamino)uracil reductase